MSGWNLKNRGSKIQERNLKRRRKKREELFAAGFLGTRTHREGSLTAGALRTGFIGAGALREGSTETGTLRAEAGAHGARSPGEGTLWADSAGVGSFREGSTGTPWSGFTGQEALEAGSTGKITFLAGLQEKEPSEMVPTQLEPLDQFPPKNQ